VAANAELILSTGEMSDTLISGLAERAAADGRPAVVLYFADFDPSGWQMPISVSRKLQALRDLRHPDLEIEVHRVAVTLEQVRAYGLPSAPLKPTEQRADRWKTVMQHEQTEIDALLALHPGEVQQLARRAMSPFFDWTLRRRTESAIATWQREARARMVAHPAYNTACEMIEHARSKVVAAADELEQAQEDALVRLRDVEPPEMIELPQPRLTDDAPDPLFASNDDYVTATQRLRAAKRWEDDRA